MRAGRWLGISLGVVGMSVLAGCGTDPVLEASKECNAFVDEVHYSHADHELTVKGWAPDSSVGRDKANLDAMECVLSSLGTPKTLVRKFTGEWEPGVPTATEDDVIYRYVGLVAGPGEPNVELFIQRHD